MTGQVGCIYPIYSDMQGIKSARFGKKMPNIMSYLNNIIDDYPKEFYETNDLLELKDMLQQMHRPETMSAAMEAKKTLFFKRLLRVQLHSLQQKSLYQ